MLLSPRAPATFREWAEALLDPITEFGQEFCESPLPAFPNDEPSLLPVATNGGGDDIYLVVTGGIADETQLWIGDVRNVEWLSVPARSPESSTTS